MGVEVMKRVSPIMQCSMVTPTVSFCVSMFHTGSIARIAILAKKARI